MSKNIINSQNLLKRAKTLFFFFFFFILINVNQNLFAGNSDVLNRVRECTPEAASVSDQEVKIEGIDGAHFENNVLVLGKDFELDATNEACYARVATYYLAFKSIVIGVGMNCGVSFTYKPIAPKRDAYTVTSGFLKMARGSANSACAVAIAALGGVISNLIGNLAITSEIAGQVYRNSRICGSNWMGYSAQKSNKSSHGYRQIVEDWVDKKEDPGASFRDDQKFREWYFQGVEREYPGCKDVNRADKNGKYPPQRYYYRGSEAATFNCENYNVTSKASWDDPLNKGEPLSEGRVGDYKEAYECCMQQQRSSICIEYDHKGVGGFLNSSGLFSNSNFGDPHGTTPEGYVYKLCEGGAKCTIKGLRFEADYQFGNTMICAQTYSLCPYNFNIGGGNVAYYYKKDNVTQEQIEGGSCLNSNIRENDCSANSASIENYCQPFKHCVVVDDSNYSYIPSSSSPYFSSACLDFKGDSRNVSSFDTGLANGQKRHFSAPIAQCVKETIENVFYNKAGHTRCRNANEIPNRQGDCINEYQYKKGEQVQLGESGLEQNFFKRMQLSLRNIIQLVLILSVMFTGFKILSGDSDALRRKEIVIYILKIALVIYFVRGDAWQSTFFEGVYKASDAISESIFKITTNENPKKRDGCQFGNVVDSKDKKTDLSEISYPSGLEYLSIWDTMDCKIARYLAMGSDFSLKNIGKLVIASLFSGPFGVWFAVFLSIFGISMVIATINMLHVFLISTISMIVLVYISLLTIPTILFSKTKDIFSKWLSALIGASLQPIILFAYIAIFISVFDNIMLGSAHFEGQAPDKRIVCEKKCITIDGNTKPFNEGEGCDIGKGDRVINPSIDSVACILSKSQVGNWPGFELISISIPVLDALFTNPQKLVKQILTLLKAALLLIILSAFVGQIPKMASHLIGGPAMAISKLSVLTIVKKAGGLANDATIRMGKVTKKLVKRE